MKTSQILATARVRAGFSALVANLSTSAAELSRKGQKMSFRILAATALTGLAATTASGPAVAAPATDVAPVSRSWNATVTEPIHSDRMLAALAHVAPGQYTDNEMIAIQRARQENDTGCLNFYLTHENRQVEAVADPSHSDRTLAALAHVAPGQYTDNEMIAIQQARQANDTGLLNMYLTHENRRAAAQPAPVKVKGHRDPMQEYTHNPNAN